MVGTIKQAPLAQLVLFGLMFGALSNKGYAREFARIPDENYSVNYVQCQDGATERLVHLSRPGAPVVLMEPGLGAHAMSLERPATRLFEQGFDVYIGAWRGSAPIPEEFSALGQGRNGLKEVLRVDLPCHLREVLSQMSDAQKSDGIRLLGHSMGGMMIAGTLSDPALKAEFAPFIRAVALYQSPHNVRYLRTFMSGVARAGLVVIEQLRRGGYDVLDTHSRLMQLSLNAKKNGNLLARLSARALEEFAILLTNAAVSSPHTGRRYMRRAFFKMTAHSVPLDLLEDFARAVLTDGEFRSHDAELLIQPEVAFAGIPVFQVSARHDQLAPLEEQKQYFARLGSEQKAMLLLEDMNHIDAVLDTKGHVSFFHHVIGFFTNPRNLVSAQPRVIVEKSACEGLLRRLAKRVRPAFL
jgi:alpha-beta hydrolase superfamily lysophospholipase